MKRCGLLGEKLGHSFSPRIHQKLGGYEYRLYEKSPQELDVFLKSGDFDGLNVTIPYKQTVIPYCAGLSPRAQAIGSVNTLVRRADGSLWGDNTDYDGFSAMLEQANISLDGKKALVLGSGGASKTVQAVLRDRGASVVVISRSGPDSYDNLDRHADARLVVNTTPVGMYPKNGAAALDIRRFPRCEAVLDVVYNPARTRLMLDAEACGIPAFGGLLMLVEQARRAAEIFTGNQVDAAVTGRLTAKLARETQNIALIGMPGCGKTTVGRALADLLGRPFYDADEQIEARAGRKIPDIFAQDGEAAFRKLETEVLAELSRQSGAVIATGGGVVTREENRDLLRQNSTVVWLQRDLHSLPLAGRPVSQSRPLNELAAERMPLYRAWCDAAVEVCGPEETAKAIQRELKI
ncbi:MAG TPA: shikimate kinase [Candidatus Ventrousia excrementavium]|uniref:Shikimate kinase n=1 Tax=Candidatus Ventrousia excrementavium TaxID=2840961 RepID=A0A9D1IRU6_9CLOT|nr:shikimate kinase [Candidatus Ventrousia excrementavium]